MGRAFVFPGQGSQAVGMGVDLAGAFATARDVFQEIDEALKQNLSKLMREGPESDLVLTENAQPALMAVSIAVIRVLEKDGGKPLASLASHVAGHSLGEYSALDGGGRPPTRRCRAASQAARPIDAEGGAGGRGRDGGPARHRARARARGLQGSSARRGRHGGQRQWRRPGRGERPQGCRRALHRDRQAARRQARHAACR